MPPVFRPRSPSSARLWSWEVGKIFAVLPSHKRVEGNLDAFEKFLDDDLRARRAESFADHDFVHRLVRLGLHWRKSKRLCPARDRRLSPRICRQRRGEIFWRRRRREKFRRAAVGMPYFSMNFWEKTLEDSNCAAFWFAPQIRRPFFWNKSTMPSASGLSGPTTVRSIFFSCAKASSLGKSSAPMLTHSTGLAVFGQPLLRDAGVAGRAPHLRGVRRLREFPDQRVLASAGADD